MVRQPELVEWVLEGVSMPLQRLPYPAASRRSEYYFSQQKASNVAIVET